MSAFYFIMEIMWLNNKIYTHKPTKNTPDLSSIVTQKLTGIHWTLCVIKWDEGLCCTKAAVWLICGIFSVRIIMKFCGTESQDVNRTPATKTECLHYVFLGTQIRTCCLATNNHKGLFTIKLLFIVEQTRTATKTAIKPIIQLDLWWVLLVSLQSWPEGFLPLFNISIPWNMNIKKSSMLFHLDF